MLQFLFSMVKRRGIWLQLAPNVIHKGVVNGIIAEDDSGTSFNIIVLWDDSGTTNHVHFKHPTGSGLTAQDPIVGSWALGRVVGDQSGPCECKSTVALERQRKIATVLGASSSKCTRCGREIG